MNIIIYVLIAFILVAAVLFIIWITTRQRRDGMEAIEEDHGYHGKREMIPFDEETALVLEKRIVKCSKCDEEVSPYDEECPGCGARLSSAIYECSNCGKEVDPREKECPHCGEILLPEPYVCPNCQKPVEGDSRKCDNCGARYWSPILLEERSVKRKSKLARESGPEEDETDAHEKPGRRRQQR